MALSLTSITRTHADDLTGLTAAAVVTSEDERLDPLLMPPLAAARTLHSWHEALSLVRTQSPELLRSVDDLRSAQARSRTALAAIFPMLDGQVGFNHQFLTSPVDIDDQTTDFPLKDVWSASATMNWSVLDVRALYARGTAQHAARVARDDLADKRRMIARTLVDSMLATLAAERVAELNRSGLSAAYERLALTEQRVHYGKGTVLDLERARQDVVSAREATVNGDEALRRTREALGLALGSATAMAAPGDLTLQEFEQAVAGSCKVRRDIEQRPDVAAASRRVLLADRAVEDVWLKFVPALALQSQTAWNSHVLYGPALVWNVRLTLNVPLWDGGARYGQLEETRAAARQARQTLVQLRLQALLDVTQAGRAVTVARDLLLIAQQRRELADRIDRRTREGYQHGMGTSLDLVTSAHALRQAEIDLALSQFRAAQARIDSLLANADCSY